MDVSRTHPHTHTRTYVFGNLLTHSPRFATWRFRRMDDRSRDQEPSWLGAIALKHEKMTIKERRTVWSFETARDVVADNTVALDPESGLSALEEWYAVETVYKAGLNMRQMDLTLRNFAKGRLMREVTLLLKDLGVYRDFEACLNAKIDGEPDAFDSWDLTTANYVHDDRTKLAAFWNECAAYFVEPFPLKLSLAHLASTGGTTTH